MLNMQITYFLWYYFFMKFYRRGFTLIEILVVVALLGLIASIILVSISNSRMKARDARRKSDLQQLVKALALYISDRNGLLPLSNECGGGGANRPGTLHGVNVTACPPTANDWYIGEYLANHGYTRAPISDPRGGTATGCRYYYYTDTTGTYFQFSAQLENPSAEDIQTTTNGALPNWSSCSIGNYRVTGSF